MSIIYYLLTAKDDAKDDFLQFVAVHNTTGFNLADLDYYVKMPRCSWRTLCLIGWTE